jgi:hypothetical protein
MALEFNSIAYSLNILLYDILTLSSSKKKPISLQQCLIILATPFPNKSESPTWKDKKMKNEGNGVKSTGKGKKKRFYDWDYTHNDIEVYDRNRRHLGSMNPTTGKMYKGPVKGRVLPK